MASKPCPSERNLNGFTFEQETPSTYKQQQGSVYGSLYEGVGFAVLSLKYLLVFLETFAQILYNT